MSTSESSPDVIVVGGGPAGLSAAAWCSELGLRTILLEQAGDIGGQLNAIYNPVNNYLGLPAASGADMLSHIRSSVALSDFALRMRAEVVGIEAPPLTVRLGDGDEITGKTLIVATGVRRRRLNIFNETELNGKGVLESGVRDRNEVRGKRVIIIGGGDAAVENALLFSELAESVKVIHRRAHPTARTEFLHQAASKTSIEFVPNTVLTGITGESSVESVELEDVVDRSRRREPAEAVLIRIGVQPNSELVADILDLDEKGYVNVNARCETSRRGVFAIGDVANPDALTISTAAGTGATAAKAAYLFLKRV
jgi:thioredoxin reductase (NADPH)